MVAHSGYFISAGKCGQARGHDSEQINVTFLTLKWSGKIHINFTVQTCCEHVLSWGAVECRCGGVTWSLRARVISGRVLWKRRMGFGADGWAGYGQRRVEKHSGREGQHNHSP